MLPLLTSTRLTHMPANTIQSNRANAQEDALENTAFALHETDLNNNIATRILLSANTVKHYRNSFAVPRLYDCKSASESNLLKVVDAPNCAPPAPILTRASTRVDAELNAVRAGTSYTLPTAESSTRFFRTRLGERLNAMTEQISSKLHFLRSTGQMRATAATATTAGNALARVGHLSATTNATSNKLAATSNDAARQVQPTFSGTVMSCTNETNASSTSLAGVTSPPLPPVESTELQCRICLASTSTTTAKAAATRGKRKIVAPCRCAGTVQYVHIACLTHWIEVSTRKMHAVPRCELCGFKFRRKPFIDLTRLHLPYVDWCDCILNLLFLFLVTIMILCGWVAIHYLCISERRPLIRPNRNTNSKRVLTDNDVTVIIASILFFAAFFIALFTQYRAEVTVLRIVIRLWATNRNWRIRDYNAPRDDAPPRCVAAASPSRRLMVGRDVGGDKSTTRDDALLDDQQNDDRAEEEYDSRTVIEARHQFPA